MSNAGSSLLNEELMVWPARSKDTMMYQVRRTIRLFSPVAGLSGGEEVMRGLVYKDLSIDRDKMTIHRGKDSDPFDQDRVSFADAPAGQRRSRMHA